MRIVVLGAGMQGTLYGVRLASAGHSVVLVARGKRAAELRRFGAVVEHALSGERRIVTLPVVETLSAEKHGDLCLVTVRREQLAQVLPAIQASDFGKILFLVNHACGSEFLFAALGRGRTVLGFPGTAGSIEAGIDRYVDVREQPTVIETQARTVGEIIRGAGFTVKLVRDMDSWLRRHAVFVTAVSGALYGVDSDSRMLAGDSTRVRNFILGIREGWAVMNRRAISPAPFALRAIFEWAPLPLAVRYWQRLLSSPRGEFYFAAHTRHAASEMAALASDVREFLQCEAAPHLLRLYAAIDQAAKTPEPVN